MALIAANVIGPALTERFRAALERLNPSGGRIGLAVSGGPDSMAMLLLAYAAIPEGFEVATVNHGLRPEAADECGLVMRECEKRGIPCAILTVNLGEGNLQQEARKARYAALGQWAADNGLSAIATAHHAGDQRETFLMRLARGSGVAGLSAIREKTQIGLGKTELIRPVLGFTRRELAGLVESAAIVPANDPSNRDDAYDRVRLRKAIGENIGFAEEFLDAAAISRSAANLAAADEALEWAARREWDENTAISASEIRYRPSAKSPAPKAIMLRVAERAIAQLGRPPRGSKLAELHDALAQGGKANLGGVVIAVKGSEWVFRPEPPRKSG